MSARTLVLCFALVGCASDTPSGDDEGPLGGSRTVEGQVVDFETGSAVTGGASVSTSGLLSSPRITTQGAGFTIEGVPDNSTFQILASVPTTHRPTFGPSIDVLDVDLADIKVPAVSDAFLTGIASGFNVTPSAAKGVLILELVDEAGNPKAGLNGNQLVLAGGVNGPHFLDANLAADDNANTSSASGYAVFFEVPEGVAELGVAAAPTVSLAMPASPVAPGTVTIARVVVTDGAPSQLPTNVSFATQIVPIFKTTGGGRGCAACHSGGGIGKDLGGLKLDGPVSQVYMELMEDPTRVQVATPENSLLLRMPSRENPPDTHPNVTFASSADPDYQKILAWITEGAKNN